MEQKILKRVIGVTPKNKQKEMRIFIVTQLLYFESDIEWIFTDYNKSNSQIIQEIEDKIIIMPSIKCVAVYKHIEEIKEYCKQKQFDYKEKPEGTNFIA